MPVTAWLLLITVALSVGRFLIPGDANSHVINGFAAVAHLFVGGLIGAFLVKRRQPIPGEGVERAYPYLLLAIALSVVEIVAFFSKQ